MKKPENYVQYYIDNLYNILKQYIYNLTVYLNNIFITWLVVRYVNVSFFKLFNDNQPENSKIVHL